MAAGDECRLSDAAAIVREGDGGVCAQREAKDWSTDVLENRFDWRLS